MALWVTKPHLVIKTKEKGSIDYQSNRLMQLDFNNILCVIVSKVLCKCMSATVNDFTTARSNKHVSIMG